MDALRTEVTDGSVITLWVPVARWPVVSLTVVEAGQDRISWGLVHESFRKAAEADLGSLSITTTTANTVPLQTTTGAAAREQIPLTYGAVPSGMHQSHPAAAAPEPLRESVHYLVVVRENVVDDCRWFHFEVSYRVEGRSGKKSERVTQKK